MIAGTDSPVNSIESSPGDDPWARYAILDTGAEAIFDALTTAAARRMGVRHSSLSIVTPSRVWLKSSTHRQGTSRPREETFCASVASDRRTLVVNDAMTSTRFAHHPRVGTTGDVRFYAGAPLIAPDGLVLGALCAWDEQPRTVSAEAVAGLEQLADHAMALLELRRSRLQTQSRDALLVATTELLDLIVTGSALPVVLDALAHAVENAMPTTRCSILLLDGMTLHHGAAPSIPESFQQAIDGARIGPSVGSCGTAAFTRQTVVVTDIATDPLWVDYRRPALAVGLRACWSVPVISSGNQVLGTFALYYDETRAPDEDDLQQMSKWVNLAEVAITRAADVAALRDAAIQDPLTGLTNRSEALRLLRELTTETDAAIAVLFVDLDQFKFVNDTLGHAAGDRILIEMAHRLAGCAGPRDTVTRIGGDEFLMICPGVYTAEAAERCAAKVIAAMRRPLPIYGRSLSQSVSVGIAMHPPAAGSGSSDLVADADLAMYAAKRSGRNSIAVFDEELRLRATERLTLESDLNDAMADGDLTCVYQPVLFIPERRLIGVEALLRWSSPTRGDVSPEVFVAAAEDSGQILVLGEFVLRRACAQLAAWRAADAAWSHVVVGVNVSPRQLDDPGFDLLVRQVLIDTQLPADRLWLEITESAVVHDSSLARATITRLRSLGVHVAIDDFGTGFSSLAKLKDVPADMLKIDRTFVTDVTIDPAAAGIVAAVVSLADALGMDVTAEGIETPEQCRALLELGCLFGQGFLWSAPLPPDQLFAMVRRGLPGDDDPTGFGLATGD